MLVCVPGVAGGSATHADAGPAAIWGHVGSLERATADCTRRRGRGVQPGMRVDVQRLLELDLPTDLALLLALEEGHRYRWSQRPARCHKPNYRSCEDNIEHAAP